jgi:5-methylcytosine-specific restriction endonuclease McrA
VGTIEASFVPVARNQPAPGPVEVTPKRSRVEPIARERYVLRACLGQETLDKLRRAQALLSHKIPNGDLPAVLDRALDALIEQLEKKKCGSRSNHPPRKPSNNSRHIPAHVRHAVWQRDGGQCTLVGESGHRCTETHLIEFDHAVPVARGGESTVENVRLRCRAHNQHEAERAFGRDFMRRKRQEANAARAEAQRQHAKQRPRKSFPICGSSAIEPIKRAKRRLAARRFQMRPWRSA